MQEVFIGRERELNDLNMLYKRIPPERHYMVFQIRCFGSGSDMFLQTGH